MAVWDKAFWRATGERVGATVVGAAITVGSVEGFTPADLTVPMVVTLVIVPGVLSFFKCLLANFGSTPGPSIGGAETLGTRVG